MSKEAVTFSRSRDEVREDPIAFLHDQYFVTCHIVYLLRQEKIPALLSHKMSVAEAVEFDCLSRLWLATLRVVCEGFVEQDGDDDLLHESISDGIERLNRFRNFVFHPQKNMNKHDQFFADRENSLSWAHFIHNRFMNFFDIHSQGYYGVSPYGAELGMSR